MMRSLVSAGCVAILVSMLAPFAHADVGPGPVPSTDEDPVVLAAGDIAQCPGLGATLTARMLDRLPGAVLAVGDLAYERGTVEEFEHCYEPTWGSHKARTYPVLGNHEYKTPGATGYFAYWGDRAGSRGKGYYSFNLGAWHLIALNSNLESAAALDQERWLSDDLAATPARCILAFWHHTVFSSGFQGQTPRTVPLYRALHAGGASVLITGHDHHYERFKPLDPDGSVDEKRGIRIFVVGTGGARLYPTLVRMAASEVRASGVWGILKLILHAESYHWEFLPAGQSNFSDAGDSRCVERETKGDVLDRP